MNMSCSSLQEMIEVTCKTFTPAAEETIPFPPSLICSNVFDHLALRGTLRFYEPDHERFTEGFVTDEVTAYVETLANIARTVKKKKATSGAIFVSPPIYMYLPRAIQQFLYIVLELAYARDLVFYIVAPNPRISANIWRSCEASYPAILAEKSKALQAYTGYNSKS